MGVIYNSYKWPYPEGYLELWHDVSPNFAVKTRKKTRPERFHSPKERPGNFGGPHGGCSA